MFGQCYFMEVNTGQSIKKKAKKNLKQRIVVSEADEEDISDEENLK